MAYSTPSEVKALLRITDASHDTEITTAIGDANVKIDNALRKYETTLPLVPTPNSINRASKYIAAGLYLKLNPGSEATQKQAETFNEVGIEFLSLYISEKYNVGAIQ